MVSQFHSHVSLSLYVECTKKVKVKVPGFSPPTSCFASRVDVNRVTPTPHHGVTHGSNVLVEKSHSKTPTRVQSAVLEFSALPTVRLGFFLAVLFEGPILLI